MGSAKASPPLQRLLDDFKQQLARARRDLSSQGLSAGLRQEIDRLDHAWSDLEELKEDKWAHDHLFEERFEPGKLALHKNHRTVHGSFAEAVKPQALDSRVTADLKKRAGQLHRQALNSQSPVSSDKLATSALDLAYLVPASRSMDKALRAWRLEVTLAPAGAAAQKLEVLSEAIRKVDSARRNWMHAYEEGAAAPRLDGKTALERLDNAWSGLRKAAAAYRSTEPDNHVLFAKDDKELGMGPLPPGAQALERTSISLSDSGTAQAFLTNTPKAFELEDSMPHLELVAREQT